MVAEARELAARAVGAARTGCEAALLAGLRMIWLHRETVSMGGDRSSVSRGTLGFEAAAAAIGLERNTAYRRMTAAGARHLMCRV